MRFASLLLLGLLATGLQADESNRVMRPVKISHQVPHDPESLPLPPVPPDAEAIANEHESIDDFVEADPLTTTAEGCDSCPPVECCPAVECCPCDCSHGCGGCCGHHQCVYCSRCNMPQHMPYYAEPSTYYYFRPYNYFHIPLIQQEAVLHGATTQNPYDTDLFEEVYRDFEVQTVRSNETLQVSPPSSE